MTTEVKLDFNIISFANKEAKKQIAELKKALTAKERENKKLADTVKAKETALQKSIDKVAYLKSSLDKDLWVLQEISELYKNNSAAINAAHKLMSLLDNANYIAKLFKRQMPKQDTKKPAKKANARKRR